MTEQNINPHLLNEESENTNGITLHDLIQMVLANWYWFALSAIICLGTAYYYLASTPKIYQPDGDHPREGQPQGRRHGSGRVQRSGRIPEPPQRRQRGLYPPVAPADVGGGQAPPPDGQLLGAGRAAHGGPVRPFADRSRFHQRQLQAESFRWRSPRSETARSSRRTSRTSS